MRLRLETRWWWWAAGDIVDNFLLLKLGCVATGSSGCWWGTGPSLSHSATLPGLWTHQPWLEGEGSLRGRDGQRSQNSKFHAQETWKTPLLLEAVLIWAAATSICRLVDRLDSHQMCFSGAYADKDFFFFQTEKKNPKHGHAKSRRSSFPCAQEFHSLCPYFFE